MASINNLGNLIRFTWSKLLRKKGCGISILVPLHLDKKRGQRVNNWKWLHEYWKVNLPGAEIIIGNDAGAIHDNLPFSKSVAVNDAARRAHGNIFVIVDADVYLSVESVLECVNEIRLAEEKGRKLWFIPYRHLFRLTTYASNKVLNSDPKNPFMFTYPPKDKYFTNKAEYQGTPVSDIGHWYGAMAQIMSRKAFYTVGGWDGRMRGWGGEDVAAMMAMDTLYGPHKTLPSQILHLCHPMFVSDDSESSSNKRRMWKNQDKAGTNDALSGRYYYSNGNPERMRKLIDEFLNQKPSPPLQKQRPIPPNMSS